MGLWAWVLEIGLKVRGIGLRVWVFSFRVTAELKATGLGLNLGVWGVGSKFAGFLPRIWSSQGLSLRLRLQFRV